MEVIYGTPFYGRKLDRLQAFLKEQDITYDASIEFSVMFLEEDEIIATGSRADNVFKCIACRPEKQGEGLAAKVLSELTKEAVGAGCTHQFLYTKPEHQTLFEALGFYTLAVTPDVLFMENEKDGIYQHLAQLKKNAGADFAEQKIIGAAVVNCNPVTNGHVHLIHTAAMACDRLHVFLVSEDKSMISAADRYELLARAVQDIPGVVLGSTGSYLISAATFPTYFLKEGKNITEINCQLDVKIFADYFAPYFNITRRYVGNEPNCRVTNAYNEQLRQQLPKRGISCREISRLAYDGMAISASQVRQWWKEERYEEIKAVVPTHVYQYLKERGYYDGRK